MFASAIKLIPFKHFTCHYNHDIDENTKLLNRHLKLLHYITPAITPSFHCSGYLLENFLLKVVLTDSFDWKISSHLLNNIAPLPNHHHNEFYFQISQEKKAKKLFGFLVHSWSSLCGRQSGYKQHKKIQQKKKK